VQLEELLRHAEASAAEASEKQQLLWQEAADARAAHDSLSLEAEAMNAKLVQLEGVHHQGHSELAELQLQVQ